MSYFVQCSEVSSSSKGAIQSAVVETTKLSRIFTTFSCFDFPGIHGGPTDFVEIPHHTRDYRSQILLFIPMKIRNLRKLGFKPSFIKTLGFLKGKCCKSIGRTRQPGDERFVAMLLKSIYRRWWFHFITMYPVSARAQNHVKLIWSLWKQDYATSVVVSMFNLWRVRLDCAFYLNQRDLYQEVLSVG